MSGFKNSVSDGSIMLSTQSITPNSPAQLDDKVKSCHADYVNCQTFPRSAVRSDNHGKATQTVSWSVDNQIGKNYVLYLGISLSSLLWRPTQLYLGGGESGEGGGRGGVSQKKEALLFQSTIDIHIQNAHKNTKRRLNFEWSVKVHLKK